MPHQLEKSVTRLFLHAAYIPQTQSATSMAFWNQFRGIPFTGNPSNVESNQVITSQSHVERDVNGEPIRQRQKIG